MKNFCDLHTHTKLSDGSSTPEELIAEAVALGLSAVALTDHNTMDGLPAFLAAAEGQNILAIPGVEFSVDYNGTELHLLGLFIEPAHFPALREITRDYLQRKDESNRELVAALTRDGYVLDYEHIQAKSPNGNINRSHIADALLEKGYCKTKEAAFKEFLAKGANQATGLGYAGLSDWHSCGTRAGTSLPEPRCGAAGRIPSPGKKTGAHWHGGPLYPL